ncbi:hypothetical protein PP175_05485 [Aneurinibacillus sp. Ricciae_BoGa-3]|uniref:hypothetical protein n=1 Tax=Aneurinibacillus sp. Ricciae_BoGa-3 TaxID=3022697 RepID=UPI0023423B86|nr:hypothetical protein [Aneurinibacillus sp. Ricciae_BoGa-3]WCK55404.1 hypothetical protein PP175_05485 [Aneurinibacillus sp. Ricciae_BoGa-3]
MLNKWHVYNALIEHYQATGEVMGLDAFQQRFLGLVSTEDAVEGLYKFETFLDASRGKVMK